ncbi:GFA family protein [Mesorhizobium sp. ZC-5]|jgi:hypothetical protein|uniref:GFA family protein n=1 Tax=Mesorhizobium sp. ZC-5 TaxID=2986066 RepID=UPI0021E802AD|nr:GFA family protein [Mesorhizobium sp. ZC-5]MCV3240375.1 GFA family protein [Mesorhizobium sp. ZC-5]
MEEGGKLTGGCLCGAVRFAATPLKAEMDVCHCSMCQQWSGGVFMSTSCGGTLEIVKGQDQLGLYRSSEWAERGFCRNCGSSLFWRGIADGHVAVSMQAFDDASRFSFAEEIFIDEKPATYSFANQTRKMTGAEVIAAYAAKQEAGHG